jgi:hypothetical protein
MNKMTELADLMGFDNKLFERMRDMHRSWLERLREIRQIEAEFGTRLLTEECVRSDSHLQRVDDKASGNYC